MAIVRNKKPQPVDPSAIAAFGAEADAKFVPAAEVAGPATPARKKPDGGKPPASSLIRWDGHEELRDSLIEFAKRERYPVHTVLLMALERGLDHLGDTQS